MNQSNFALVIELSLIAIGGIIMGASAVGIQLEKIKRQRDEALKRLERLYEVEKHFEKLDEMQKLRQGTEENEDELF